MIDEKLGQLEGVARDSGNLGIILKTRGELDEAEAMYLKALEIYEKLNQPAGLASIMAMLLAKSPWVLSREFST